MPVLGVLSDPFLSQVMLQGLRPLPGSLRWSVLGSGPWSITCGHQLQNFFLLHRRPDLRPHLMQPVLAAQASLGDAACSTGLSGSGGVRCTTQVLWVHLVIWALPDLREATGATAYISIGTFAYFKAFLCFGPPRAHPTSVFWPI